MKIVCMLKEFIIPSVNIMGEDTFIALPYEPLGFTAYGLVYDITRDELKGFVYPYTQ